MAKYSVCQLCVGKYLPAPAVGNEKQTNEDLCRLKNMELVHLIAKMSNLPLKRLLQPNFCICRQCNERLAQMQHFVEHLNQVQLKIFENDADNSLESLLDMHFPAATEAAPQDTANNTVQNEPAAAVTADASAVVVTPSSSNANAAVGSTRKTATIIGLDENPSGMTVNGLDMEQFMARNIPAEIMQQQSKANQFYELRQRRQSIESRRNSLQQPQQQQPPQPQKPQQFFKCRVVSRRSTLNEVAVVMQSPSKRIDSSIDSNNVRTMRTRRQTNEFHEQFIKRLRSDRTIVDDNNRETFYQNRLAETLQDNAAPNHANAAETASKPSTATPATTANNLYEIDVAAAVSPATIEAMLSGKRADASVEQPTTSAAAAAAAATTVAFNDKNINERLNLLGFTATKIQPQPIIKITRIPTTVVEKQPTTSAVAAEAATTPANHVPLLTATGQQHQPIMLPAEIKEEEDVDVETITPTTVAAANDLPLPILLPPELKEETLDVETTKTTLSTVVQKPTTSAAAAATLANDVPLPRATRKRHQPIIMSPEMKEDVETTTPTTVVENPTTSTTATDVPLPKTADVAVATKANATKRGRRQTICIEQNTTRILRSRDRVLNKSTTTAVAKEATDTNQQTATATAAAAAAAAATATATSAKKRQLKDAAATSGAAKKQRGSDTTPHTANTTTTTTAADTLTPITIKKEVISNKRNKENAVKPSNDLITVEFSPDVMQQLNLPKPYIALPKTGVGRAAAATSNNKQSADNIAGTSQQQQQQPQQQQQENGVQVNKAECFTCCHCHTKFNTKYELASHYGTAHRQPPNAKKQTKIGHK